MNKVYEALSLAGALFPVEKRTPIDPVTFEPVPDFAQVVRTDTNVTLNYVGRDFGLISHEQAFSGVAEMLPELENRFGTARLRAETYVRSKRGTRNLVDGSFVNLLIEFPDAARGPDRLFPSLRVKHGVAGEASLSAVAGVFREVCSNGLTIGDKKLVAKVRHTANARYKLERFEALVNNAVGEIDRLDRLMLDARRVTRGDYPTVEGAVRYLLTGANDPEGRKPRGFDDALNLFFTAPGADPSNANGYLQLGTYLATHEYGRGANPLDASGSAGADRIRARALNLTRGAAERNSVLAALHDLTI